VINDFFFFYIKIMDTLFLFPFYIFFLMLPILGVIMYFVMVRKNAFEERLALYRPQHQLSQKREAYLKGVHKFRLWIIGIAIVMFTAPLLIFFIVMLQEAGIRAALYSFFPNEMITLVIYLIVFLVYWLLSYVFKRNEKALRMLVEQMSDSDFDLLLKVKDYLSLDNRYSPPFVLCNHQLYLFLFYTIREIDPAKITDMKCNWGWGRSRNSVFVRVKLSKKTIGIVMPEKAFSYFQRVVEKYAKLKF